MNYTVTRKQATMPADEFVRRYRDIDRIGALCLQCPGYGKSWACPPFDFDPATISDGFSEVILMGAVIEFDGRGARHGEEAIQEVLHSLLPELYEQERQHPGSRCFTFRCSLCPQGCTRPQGKPCRHPELMRYSLESVGFDVVAMTRDLLDVDMEWTEDGSVPRRVTLVTALFRR